MIDLPRLQSILKEQGIRLSRSLVEDDDQSGTIYAFVDGSSYASTKDVPSRTKLDRIADILRREGYEVTFILDDHATGELESSLQAMVQRYFPDWVQGTAVFDSAGKQSFIVSPKASLSDERERDIRAKIEALCEVFAIELDQVFFLKADRSPSQTAVMKAMRLVAPCTIDELMSAMERGRRGVPDRAWMNRTLDNLRRKGFITRDADEKYFLSMEGLLRLGTRKHRGSADISRALALPNRGSTV